MLASSYQSAIAPSPDQLLGRDLMADRIPFNSSQGRHTTDGFTTSKRKRLANNYVNEAVDDEVESPMIKPYQGSTGGKKVSRQISIHEEDRDSSSLLEEEEAKLKDHFDQSSAGRMRNGNVMHTKLRS